jgi:hypothetical protein
MFRTPEQATFANVDDSNPLDLEWMTDLNVEMLLDIEQTLSADTIDLDAGTDSHLPKISTTDQTTFPIPTDLAPIDVAWMVDLLDKAEQSDIIGSSLDQSSLQLVPYHAPTLTELPESTVIVSSKRPPGTNEGEGPKPKRYSLSETISNV